MRMQRMMLGAAALVLIASTANAKPGDPGRDKVAAAVKADHDASIERLRDWIKLPTIANMNVNHREGAEYMKQLALDAGFQPGEGRSDRRRTRRVRDTGCGSEGHAGDLLHV